MKPCVLTIAGSDSGAGAGIQADARVFQTLGCFATTAITAVTAQNTLGVQSWSPVAPALLQAQIESVLGDFNIVAVKAGLLPGKRAVEAVVRGLGSHSLPLIIDPVIASSSGTVFLDNAGLKALKDLLLPRASLVTPNLPEAEALSGVKIRKPADLEIAIERILALGCGAVLVKGGHGRGRLLQDVLATAAGTRSAWSASRIDTVNTHGTGCVLSAGIAAGAAQGWGLIQAIEQARRLLQVSLARGGEVQWGAGRGPAFAGW